MTIASSRSARRSIPVRTIRLLARLAALLSVFGLLGAQAVSAQMILRDAETEALMRDATAPLARAAGLSARNVEVLVINDKSINAFVAGGQIVWLHSGLIATADNLNQVQGVVAHELGHIEGGHVIRSAEGMKEAAGIQIVTLLLGAAALAAGGGEAGMGIMAAGQQAAMGKYLAFSRAQESSADAAGVRYLHDAGISGKGSVDFFKKLQKDEYRLYVPQDTYVRTHPLSTDRIAALRFQYEQDPAWSHPTDQQLEARFQRVKGKLIGFVEDAPRTLQIYPLSDQSVPAHYARAYAYHKGAYTEQALAEVAALLKTAPHDPYFLELEGQVLLESGKPQDAIAPLREAVERTGGEPLIAVSLGHALVATDDNSYLDEAERVLRNALARDRENPFAWYTLGNVYQRKGDTPRAALATAERYSMEGQYALALRHAEVAMGGIAPNSPDYLRAQDISMVSRAALEKDRKR